MKTTLPSFVLVVGLLTGCSSTVGLGDPSNLTTDDGGAGQGGNAQGGSAQGGSAQGGSAQGGSAQGGRAQGGSSQGGQAGAAQGGSSGSSQDAGLPDAPASSAKLVWQVEEGFVGSGPYVEVFGDGSSCLRENPNPGDGPCPNPTPVIAPQDVPALFNLLNQVDFSPLPRYYPVGYGECGARLEYDPGDGSGAHVVQYESAAMLRPEFNAIYSFLQTHATSDAFKPSRYCGGGLSEAGAYLLWYNQAGYAGIGPALEMLSDGTVHLWTEQHALTPHSTSGWTHEVALTPDQADELVSLLLTASYDGLPHSGNAMECYTSFHFEYPNLLLDPPTNTWQLQYYGATDVKPEMDAVFQWFAQGPLAGAGVDLPQQYCEDF